jgi:hypothetical protein
MTNGHRRATGALAVLVVVAVVAVVGGACGVCERPTLVEAGAIGGEMGAPTGNQAADEVLGLLEGDLPEEVTANYSITTKLGGTTRPARVVRSGDRLSVTIGDVRFLHDAGDQTCNLTTGSCEEGLQEARVSDTAVTSQFYAAAPARVLRVALARATGAPVASSETVGEHPATCVAVPSGQGDERTCATPAGLVALWDTAAVTVQLQDLTTTADDADFATSR